ncbi:MAG: AAA family ATPase [Chloroflexi bacterium]|nr:AAA family ATPase [Chloroflexota bacterium]
MSGTETFIKTIRLTNLLSFGASTEETRLGPLNVLIGPNAVGKSNLIEALGVLQAAPRDLTEPFRKGGGIGEWLWKGTEPKPTAEIAVVLDNPAGSQPLRYKLSFTMVGQRLELIDEALENLEKSSPREQDVYFYYRFQRGNPVLNVRDIAHGAKAPFGHPKPRYLKREDLHPEQSVLSQRKDPEQYPELTLVAKQFSRMVMYREWHLGRQTAPRLPQKPDLPQDFLLEDASNLVLVLNSLEHKPGVKAALIARLKSFYRDVDNFTAKIEQGTVQLFFHEKGLREPVPATRLSDGTLRYLCLLSVLCHPTPPPLVCIEEPELGLHPDALKSVAELLVDASTRTQLIVTTHSDTLVSDLSTVPESVIVCERGEDGTTLRRLDRASLEEWLERYTLGELWRMGEIGGNP